MIMTVIIPKGVLFDLDGTLIRDTSPHYERALQEACALHSITLNRPVDPSIAERNLIEILLDEGVPAKIIANVVRERRVRINALLETSIMPTEGAQELLMLLVENDIPRGLVTDAGRVYVDRISRCVPIKQWFDGYPIVTRDTLAENTLQRKPAPDSLLHAARLLKMDPSTLVYVGDRREDVHAAIDAGMQSCFVGPDIDYVLSILATQTASSLRELFHRMTDTD